MSMSSVERKTSVYKDLSDRFLFYKLGRAGKDFVKQKREFSHQYSHIYAERLMTVKPLLTLQVQQAWGPDVSIRRLCDVKAQEECVVIGTLYKDMPLKPNVLKSISVELRLDVGSVLERYTHKSDRLILEDELQRIRLQGMMQAKDYVTGIVIAVKGVPQEGEGIMNVTDVLFLNVGLQPPRPVVSDPPKFLAILSGLNVGSTNAEHKSLPLQLMLLFQQLNGFLMSSSSEDNVNEMLRSIVRVIVAGNCISPDTVDRNAVAQQALYLSRKTAAGSIEAMERVDRYFFTLASSVEVDVMAGSSDPAGVAWPQQPPHKVMFPKASEWSSFHTRSNPYLFSMDDVIILGTNGQNVDQLLQYSDVGDNLDCMEATLRWGHMAPTCPDTLPCYPYTSQEPFLMHDMCPHIYFAANQERFAWRRCRVDTRNYLKASSKTNPEPLESSTAEVLLVSVPRFSDTGVCVLVDLHSMTCESIEVPPLPQEDVDQAMEVQVA